VVGCGEYSNWWCLVVCVVTLIDGLYWKFSYIVMMVTHGNEYFETWFRDAIPYGLNR